MLELKNIKKSYKTGTFIQHALNGINLKFRKNEFVAILGPSGSGKTTLLNIIGGLDRYDSGDLLIKGKSTKKFKDKDFDAYRNKSIGFIFQSYNLISHISILDNVEMGMTLSGKKYKVRRKKAKELLKKVGLGDHMHKKPNQLSGGQMQRVAIARALANDPEIILADEPTGALDTKTSVQIMKLIKEIAEDKLVIMVTHNPDLAKDYASRVINMKDGEIINDSNKYDSDEEDSEYKLKKTKMSFFTALYLSLNNIKTKKGRTLITAFASSIGIIGIALILSLSNGFQNKIDDFEHQVSDAMPIIISATKQNITAESIRSAFSSNSGMTQEDEENDFTDERVVKKVDEDKSNVFATSINPITDDYMEYINNIPKEYVSSSLVDNSIRMNLIQKSGDKYINLDRLNVNIMPIPIKYDENKNTILENYYDVLEGKLPVEKDEIVVEVSKSNMISSDLVKALNLNGDEYTFDDILKCTIKLVNNDTYYKNIGNLFIPDVINEKMYNDNSNLTLKVVGIIRIKEDKYSSIGLRDSKSSLYTSNKLQDYVKESAKNSKIVKEQEKADYNVLTGLEFDNTTEMGKYERHMTLLNLGAIETPGYIYIYPNDFNSTEKIVEYLNKYNDGKEEKDKVSFINQAELISNMSGSIMDGITAVLIAFSAISLVVSSIMLGIITYISVLERTKEIGILRSLGARKKDIKRVFNAETVIIGLVSGLLGIIIALLLIIPINNLLYDLTTLENVAELNPIHAVILIAISMVLTLIGGAIPAHIASKQDVVTSLRTE
ncbi:MAG: ABC transporter ATP-binding protein/permease [Firmicutes bacterium]|nr:ABC transporter ATP-binding protein/permease [Bacillota bacterium]